MSGTPKPEDIAAAAATTTSTGPAQIQALAAINKRAAELHAAGMLGPAWATAAVQLLAESAGWRARCDVSSQDVKAAGVTLAQCEAWLASRDWMLGSHPDNVYRTWQRPSNENVNLWPSTETDPLGLERCVAVTIVIQARGAGLVPHDVLEEMAAI